MTNSIGMAAGPAKWLKPLPTPAKNMAPGRYLARMGIRHASLEWLKLSGLELGLLTKTPSLDGLDYIELTGPGYQRQPFEITLGGSGHMLANANAISFGPGLETWPEATHACIFTDEDQILGFGRLAFMGASGGADCVSFGEHGVMIHRH